MTDVEHEPGCALDPVHWMRHALGAAQRLLSTAPDPETRDVDRTAAVALLDELERRVEFDDGWRSVTLYEVAKNATLMRGDDWARLCTCPARRTSRDWK